jgi:WD40-like Beta Propeller Repeat
MRLLLSLLATLTTTLVAAQSPPAKLQPTMVEGVLSTVDDELNTAFTPDGQTVYFSKNVGDRIGVIVVSRWEKDRWGEPQVAPFSGQYSDYDPFVSPDGSRLFWISNRPVDGKEKEDYDIWMVEKRGNGWGSPVHLPAPINTDAEEFYPSVTAKGTLYFSSTRPGGMGRGDPYIASDESYIVFASYGRPESAGSGDLYVSYNSKGIWSAARPLEHGVNSKAREYCPIVSPDGKWLYFTSFRAPLDTPPGKPVTFPQLTAKLRTPLNGYGNVYRIPIAALELPSP